jgi:hypothetical protein
VSAADLCGLIGSFLLLVSAIRDTVLRWWIWVLRHRRYQPGLAGLRRTLTARHQEARDRPLLDSLTLAAGAFFLMLSYLL